MSCMCISLFDRKKDTLNKTNYKYLTFKMNTFLVQTLKCIDTLLYLFCPWKYIKKTLISKIGYISKTVEIFQYCPIWPKIKKVQVFIVFGINNFGLCSTHHTRVDLYFLPLHCISLVQWGLMCVIKEYWNSFSLMALINLIKRIWQWRNADKKEYSTYS